MHQLFFLIPQFTYIGLVFLYIRDGQSVALQRFSAAPVSNFGCTTQQFMTYLCMKIPKIYIFMEEKIRQKKFLRPAIQYFNEIWPARKKVWPPATPVIHLRKKLVFENFNVAI